MPAQNPVAGAYELTGSNGLEEKGWGIHAASVVRHDYTRQYIR